MDPATLEALKKSPTWQHVARFSLEMERRLSANPLAWETDAPAELTGATFDHLEKLVKLLLLKYGGDSYRQQILAECAHIAIFAMLTARAAGALPESDVRLHASTSCVPFDDSRRNSAFAHVAALRNASRIAAHHGATTASREISRLADEHESRISHPPKDRADSSLTPDATKQFRSFDWCCHDDGHTGAHESTPGCAWKPPPLAPDAAKEPCHTCTEALAEKVSAWLTMNSSIAFNHVKHLGLAKTALSFLGRCRCDTERRDIGLKDAISEAVGEWWAEQGDIGAPALRALQERIRAVEVGEG